MTIQGAFISAMTSLAARQAAINTISNNIANASTSGYSAEQTNNTAIVYNNQVGGVDSGTVTRVTNATLTAAYNQSTSSQAYSQAMTDVLSDYVSNLNTTSSTDSTTGSTTTSNVLTTSLSNLQSALTSLSSSPGTTTQQTSALTAAQDVVSTINGLSSDISDARKTADSNIATGVTAVNSDLQAIDANEKAIVQAKARGESTAALEDKRDQLVSDISQYLPVKTITQSNGTIALVTDGGTTLYDGTVHELKFTQAGNVSYDTTSGLSQVTMADGSPLQTSQSGSIAANLQLRDSTLLQFGTQLDELTANLVTTFQSNDSTVTAGQAGLFTVAGAAYTTGASTTGLAANLAINASVDPDQGGDVSRIQFGVQATAADLSSAQASDTSIVNAFISGMSSSSGQTYSSASGISATNLVSAGGEIASFQQTLYSTWSSRNDTRSSDLTTAQTSLSNATGVNVDEQMQRLLMVQQTYTASAQVLQAAAKMLETMNTVAAGVL